ncbi:MAG: hypothetical protein QXG86_04035 [Candidatus Woesearchaeota archaeon]
MPQQYMTPNEFRSFIISNFRMFLNQSTVGGRQEVHQRIVRECNKVLKSPTITILSPPLQEALEFVVTEFASNTNMMSPNIQREMLRILEKII